MEFEKEVRISTQELELTIDQLNVSQHLLLETQKEMIHRFSMAAEYRVTDMSRHIKRISSTSVILAKQMGLSDSFCELIQTASMLHDVGKMEIPDSIVMKSDELTVEENERLKSHTVIGSEILSGSEYPLLKMAQQIALSHHEWYDGSGYLFGIKGEEIPLSARIVAVADSFDELISINTDDPECDIDPIIQTIVEQRGTHFDPQVIDAFLSVIDRLSGLSYIHQFSHDTQEES